MSNEKLENETVYVGVGWNAKTKTGDTFISCKLNRDVKAIEKDFLLFKNNRKREGKQDPDYNIVLSK